MAKVNEKMKKGWNLRSIPLASLVDYLDKLTNTFDIPMVHIKIVQNTHEPNYFWVFFYKLNK